MAYCSHTDVESEFKDLTLSASTSVTDTEVDAWCDQESSLIDGLIQNRYDVPVTGTAALLILKAIVIMLVKARLISVLSVKTPIDSTKQDPDSQKLKDQAMKLLDLIAKGKLALVDAVLAGSGTGGMTSYLIDGDIEGNFDVVADNW